MARYLLSSRTVLDIIQRKGEPGERWLTTVTEQRHVTASDVCVSAVAPMSVRREIEQRIERAKGGEPDDAFSLDDLLQMQRNANTFFNEYGEKNRIVPVTAAVADRWSDLLNQKIAYIDGQSALRYEVGSVQKLEMATAIVGRNNISFIYVERAQPGHQGINGLIVQDPTAPVENPS